MDGRGGKGINIRSKGLASLKENNKAKLGWNIWQFFFQHQHFF